jgi:hypothetical protein
MNVYWFQDSKTGHLKQVQALLDQLKKEIELSITPINYPNHESLSDMLANENQLDEPSILIGAGHDVYSKILQAKKYLKKYTTKDVFSIAVLRPSYKLNSFDLIIAPEHDFRRRRLPKNVTPFQGSLAAISHHPVDENKAIIAIGGPSKHYKFDEEILMKQLHYILSMHPNYEFKIFNSRRTPHAFNSKIKEELNQYSNAKFIDLDSPGSNTFQDNLNQSALKFVTPDSSNLVFESLSAYGKTYLIQIEDPKYRRIFGAKKIRESMNELVDLKRVGIVSIINKKGGADIYKIENPSAHFEPLAEVKKIAFSIMKFINPQK